jgi:predicted Zn-dependent peptidase
MKGMSAKNANKENENLDNNEIENSSDSKKNLSEELEKLNNLLKDGVLTQEEFEKAKKKILDN